MPFTRGGLLDSCASILGDSSTAFRGLLLECLIEQLYAFWDLHDWNFKHKNASFNTVAGTEIYNLATPAPLIRSGHDIEVLYDVTNKRPLHKVDYRDIKRAYPGEDQTGQPTAYAPWGGNTSIYLSPVPDNIYTLKFGYLTRPTEPTTDADDLELVCGLPPYGYPLFKKLVLAEGMLYQDETRRDNILGEAYKILLPKAIAADMVHLETGARWKYWEEEISPRVTTYDDFLRATWWGSNNSGF